MAQFGGVTPAVGKTPRQTAPFRRSSVVAPFSDTRAMLPLASRARPTARRVRATCRFAGDQTLLSGDTSVASCGNFPNHHSWHATPHFFAGSIVPPSGEIKRTAILTFSALVKLPEVELLADRVVLLRHGSGGCRGQSGRTDLPDVSSPLRKNISVFPNTNHRYIRLRPVPPKGAYHDRRERGAGCGGRGGCF